VLLIFLKSILRLALKATIVEIQPQKRTHLVSGVLSKEALLVISGSIAMLLVQPLNLVNHQAQLLVKLPSSNYKKPSKLHPTVEEDSQLTMLLFQEVGNSLILI